MNWAKKVVSVFWNPHSGRKRRSEEIQENPEILSFKCANMTETKCDGISFGPVDFQNVTALDADFSGAEFGPEADFRGADLRNADFRGSKIFGMKIDKRTNLEGADFTGATVTGEMEGGLSLVVAEGKLVAVVKD